MTAPAISIVHLSDLHFGGYADLAQIEALEDFLPTLGAAATVVSGDLSQRARHGEFQAAHAFLQRLRAHAPVLVVPGNHDLEWWKSPLGLAGGGVKYAKYARYFGDLTPVLTIPGAIIAGALSSYGVAFGSLTWNLNDVAVKGHLPASETTRVAAIFAQAPADAVRILTFHHNVLPGRHLAADGARQLAGGLPAAPRHRGRRHPLRARPPRGGGADRGRAGREHGRHPQLPHPRRPPVGLQSRQDRRPQAVHIRHYRWEAAGRQFLTSDMNSFARQGPPRVAVSVAGGSGPAGVNELLGHRLAQLGLRDVDRILTHTNRTVMISLARRVLRLHRGYASAPDRVLRAIVRFLDPRLPRAARRGAEREFLGLSRRAVRAPAAAAVRRERPGPATSSGSSAWSALHERLNAAHFGGALGTIPIRLSGRMRTRLGELAVDLRTGRPLEIAISRRHLLRHPWPEVEHTMLHEMVHQWQAETGLAVDHGRRSGRRRSRWGSSRRRAGWSLAGTADRRGVGVPHSTAGPAARAIFAAHARRPHAVDTGWAQQ